VSRPHAGGIRGRAGRRWTDAVHVAEELATYIELQHLEQPIVVGHSLGGNIAIDLASRHPALVGSVVIVDSLPFYAGAWFQAKSLEDARPMIASMHAYMTT
jgi:pimeloyl-ACP methyl ester carboxylesterase